MMELLRSQDPAEGIVKIFNSFDTDIRHGVPESVCILKINKQPADYGVTPDPCYWDQDPKFLIKSLSLV